MPAFEGLRVLRIHVQRWPDSSIPEIVNTICRTNPSAASYDFEAAVELHEFVPSDAPSSGMDFYRTCLAAILLRELPEWAKLITLGRGRFIKRLSSDEYRDIRSIFRQAHLLDDPPSSNDVDWWDGVQTHVRRKGDDERMRRARLAEQLSIAHEASRLCGLGIDKAPQWMAIEDNTAGYDVLSFNPGEFGPLNRLIEVKSTVASPLRFYLTRNEWDNAVKFGDAYIFHVWDLQQDPAVLYEMKVAEVAPHVPQDKERGQWKTAQIPVGKPSAAAKTLPALTVNP
ncbi:MULTISPECIES: DUF3883 domain-containing protein [Dyella]|uniref:DUF3883 domain-containing protein n=2 Tax=Dyella TaxID=231454 RepID=A0A4R0YRE7_9GAMM|nr:MULTISPECIES: DUF3883 domain-containing protein [Dyella]TBR36465.1 DUF3883 domain-containing protein [Dyella terrae]TCI08443.1 DUF3883 domain-containing protein [Dyella soli]